jgi:GT2 family glycosyltransferase
MPRQTVQRLVRLSPRVARIAWGALPGSARQALSRFVYPIASGPRRGGKPLEVEKPSRAARFDVVVFSGAELAAAERARLSMHHHRVFDIGSTRPEDLARHERVLDAVAVFADADLDSRNAAVRMGWRPAAASANLERCFPEVTIVIPTHAQRELCRNCLHAVLGSTGWGRYRIVVVDDGSEDGTREMLAELSSADSRISVVRLDSRHGFGPACNLGLARAKGDYVVLLNDDTVVAPGWLSRLVAHLESDPGLAMICPVTNQIGNRAKIEVDYASFEAMEALAVDRAVTHVRRRFDVPTIALFCAAARKDALEAAGWLDERYEIGMFEDDDLSMTLRKRGFRLAVALDSYVHHVGQATLGQLDDADYLAIWEANKKRFEDKWEVVWRPPER